MLKHILSVLAGAMLLILGVMFSIVAIAVATLLGLAAWGYFFWKTRKMRRTMRERAANDQVIEGEAVVVDESRVQTTLILPDDQTKKL